MSKYYPGDLLPKSRCGPTSPVPLLHQFREREREGGEEEKQSEIWRSKITVWSNKNRMKSCTSFCTQKSQNYCTYFYPPAPPEPLDLQQEQRAETFYKTSKKVWSNKKQKHRLSKLISVVIVCKTYTVVVWKQLISVAVCHFGCLTPWEKVGGGWVFPHYLFCLSFLSIL